jgi:uncharacterized iron-regulated protein
MVRRIAVCLLALSLQACCCPPEQMSSFTGTAPAPEVVAETTPVQQPPVRQVSMAEIHAAILAQNEKYPSVDAVTQPGCQQNFNDQVAAVSNVLHSYNRM